MGLQKDQKILLIILDSKKFVGMGYGSAVKHLYSK